MKYQKKAHQGPYLVYLKLIRRFIKKCKKERIIEDYLDRRFYEKPSSKRRREKLKKIKNARKAEAERNRSNNS